MRACNTTGQLPDWQQVRGANPLKLPNGETRKWLEDGDKLTITGWCQGDRYRLGFGEVSGRILPAVWNRCVKSED
jgi:hypothetical protein